MATTLCLNMIVRNEARIVERALASVRDYIDAWVICDTGSTDGTQVVIADLLRRWGVPGELHQRPWVDFGHNRTEALRLAKHKADYILLMDADMVLRVDDPAFKARLDRDTYLVRQGGPLVYYNPRIVSGTLDYTYVGVTHEYLRCDAPGAREGILDGISFDDFADGSNRSTKLPRDIALLEAGLREDPANRRYQFYLAQSYFDAGQYARAIEWYTRRIAAGGWPEEVFYSRYRRAQAKLRLGVPWDEVLQDYLECIELHPHRLEPLHAAVYYCRTHDLHALGYELGCRGLTTPYPERDRLFVEKEVYDYRLLDETSVCAFYAGRYREGKQMCLALLAGGGLPVTERPRVEANLRFFEAALGEGGHARPAPAASPRARKTVVFYVGYARLFDGESIAEDAYGSELALLALVAQLAPAYDVFVFGSTLTDRVGRDGVRYGSSAALRAFDRPIDVLIICRYLHYFLEFEHRAAKTFIWCHDTCLHPSWEGRQLPADGKHLFRSVQHLVDGVVVLSPWHRRHFLDLYGTDDDKVFVIGNGIDPRHFDQPVAKQANKLVWTSSPSRGLRRLLAYLDEVREQIPDLTLFVYRGEGDVDSEMREQMAARPYVRYGGKQDNAVVISEYLSADLWVYPTDFHETYCNSALEAQMAGCVCVCSRLGALETTVGERGILIDPPLHDEAYDRRMIDAIVRVLRSDELKREYRARGIEWARHQTWEARARQWIALFGDDVATAPAPLASGRPAGHEVGRRQRVKLLWNWTDSKTLCDI
ncbi:MAG TPA: glycosyltransferase, partial [Candidatus Acidoferrum sp.]|nr:glycosyltransferase [Candidatus Acidoferrum sp.]